MKDFIKIFLLTIFFSVVILFINYTFFTDNRSYIEEKYIDPVITEAISSAKEETILPYT